ncbi:MAG: diaminopimelate epimerase [Oscillospiraceae bacterium]|nr:diaminopimelate epimerase [Oscillospiraceae bacterium]MCL2278794.1 diaminopimelate epimerase [Oscillospiraceae bacterium]
MNLNFTKMHGAGNDYIFIDCFDITIDNPESLSISLSDRHFGIGGDGLVMIMRSDNADAKMRMFNSDGSEGKMCGNAIRCVAKYLYDNNIISKQKISIETLSGIKILSLTTQSDIVTHATVDMGNAILKPELIPVRTDALPADSLSSLPESIVGVPVNIGGAEYAITCVSMGNPHVVIFCENVDNIPLSTIGPLFENAPLFPDRVNTEFVQVIGRNRLKMRVWERGSGETLACGTGACAAAVAAVLNGHCDEATDISVLLPGGELIINYSEGIVHMTGDCIKVFSGTIEMGATVLCGTKKSDTE